MSSLKRMLSILDLFSPERPTLTAEEIIRRLQISQPTGYRYIQELCSAGLLSSQSGEYGLGVRIIELDYQMRRCDPLLGCVQPAMRSLAERLFCDVLLAVYIGGRVVVTRHERGASPIRISFGRGHVMPLFRGAASKAILAGLPVSRQRRLYGAMAVQIAEAGLGEDWLQFRANLMAIRKAKQVASHAELEPGNVGVAVTLASRPGMAPASLVLVFDAANYALLDPRRVGSLLLAARDSVDEALSSRSSTASLIDAPRHSIQRDVHAP